MALGLLFWVLMILTLIFGGWQWHTGSPQWPWGNSLLVYILLGLLGWAVFGAPIR